MISYINSIEVNKASGPNSIPPEIFKLIKANICFPLTEIINMSFATGTYPDQLKVAKVIPIFKNKGDNLDVSNYSPWRNFSPNPWVPSFSFTLVTEQVSKFGS